MRKTLLLLLFLSATARLSGQLLPVSSQYLVNLLYINPAAAGRNEALTGSLCYRNQWTGLEGSPKSVSFILEAPLKKESVGLGIVLTEDHVGFTSGTSLQGNYAFRFRLGRGKLSLGLSTALTRIGIDWNSIRAVDPDDELIYSDQKARLVMDFGFGAFYYGPVFYAGASIPSFANRQFLDLDEKLSLGELADQANLVILAGGRFPLAPSTSWNPSFLLRYNLTGEVQADLTMGVVFLNRLSTSLTYRSGNALVGMLEYMANDQLSLGYAYDYSLFRPGNNYYGSHEISLRYRFGYRVDIPGPRNF